MMAAPVYTTHNATDVLEEFLKELGIHATFRIASTTMLTTETYAAVQDAKAKIKTMGIKQAFRLAGMQLVFSGPRRHIQNKICKPLDILNNTKRCRQYAKSQEHTLLDTAKMGKWVKYYKKYGVYPFIEKPFGGRKGGSKAQTDFYMGCISVAMILSKQGDVESFFTGADWRSVGLIYELPALMVNTKIKNINGRSADELREIYYSGAPDAVYKTFQTICEDEQALTLQRMKSPNKHKRRLARRDFEAQCKFFELEQEDRRLELKRGTFIGAMRGVLALKTATNALT
jgi:hypothetical protein